MMSLPPAISIRDVSKRYGRTLALDAISFQVGAGELFALLGPNGAGKTTLVNILCTILRPDSGSATIAGADVIRQPLSARRNLGVVFQEPTLDDRLTVYENLEFHGLIYGVRAAARRKRIPETLALMGLSDHRDTLTRALSSGMKRRLEIGRTLIHDSTILILDEPTTGLDAQSRENIWTHLRRLRSERGLTIVVTTHYIEEVEEADRVCIIDGGKILALDTPDMLKLAEGHDTIRVLPRDEAIGREILSRWPDLATASGQRILLRVPSRSGFQDQFLAAFGSRMREIAFEKASLESVFLSMTGRELRDHVASARDRTLAFSQRGGEHTR